MNRITNPVVVRILWEISLLAALLGMKWRRNTLRNWRRVANNPPAEYVKIDGEWYTQL